MLDHTPRRSAFSTKRELLVCLSIPQNSKKQNPENRINMNKHEQTIHFQPVSDTKIVALHRFGSCSSRWSTRRRSGPRHQKIDPQRSLNQPGWDSMNLSGFFSDLYWFKNLEGLESSEFVKWKIDLHKNSTKIDWIDGVSAPIRRSPCGRQRHLAAQCATAPGDRGYGAVGLQGTSKGGHPAGAAREPQAADQALAFFQTLVGYMLCMLCMLWKAKFMEYHGISIGNTHISHIQNVYWWIGRREIIAFIHSLDLSECPLCLFTCCL